MFDFMKEDIKFTPEQATKAQLGSRCIGVVIFIKLVPSIHNKCKTRCISTVQLGYIWRHVSTVNRPSSGQQGIVLLRNSQ